MGAHGRKNLENLRGHMVTEKPVNVSKVTRVVCDMERWTQGLGEHLPEIARGYVV